MMPGPRLDNIPRRSTDSGTAVTGENGDSLLLGRGGSSDLSMAWAQALMWLPDMEGKEPTQQLELLNQQLEKESRIKDGAENLLRMQLTVRELTVFSMSLINHWCLYFGILG